MTEYCKNCKELADKLANEKDIVEYLRKKAEFDMPEEMRGQFHNGQCPDVCDMIDGPCACGAWHSAKEWIDKLNTKLAAVKEKNKRLQDEIQARRQWQKCPRCDKTFATIS